MHNGQYSHSHQQDLYVTEAAVSKIRYRHGICDWSVFFHANQYNYSVLWINIMYWSQACTVSTSNSLERALIGVVVILYSINGAKVFSLNMRRCVIFRCSFLLPSFCFCLPFTLNSLLTHTRTHTHTHTHTSSSPLPVRGISPGEVCLSINKLTLRGDLLCVIDTSWPIRLLVRKSPSPANGLHGVSRARRPCSSGTGTMASSRGSDGDELVGSLTSTVVNVDVSLHAFKHVALGTAGESARPQPLLHQFNRFDPVNHLYLLNWMCEWSVVVLALASIDAYSYFAEIAKETLKPLR